MEARARLSAAKVMLNAVVNVCMCLRRAIHNLLRASSFTFLLIAILSLSTASLIFMYAVLDSLVLNPIRIENIERVVSIKGAGEVPHADRIDWWGQAPSLQSLAIYDVGSVLMTSRFNSQAHRTSATVVTSEFFNVLDIQAQYGHTFDKKDYGRNMVVLSHKIWRSYFQQTDVIGSNILLNGASFQIVAIMPQSFTFPGQTDLWVLDDYRTFRRTSLRESGQSSLSVSLLEGMLGRLRPSATVQGLRSEINTIYDRTANVESPHSNWRRGMPPTVQSLEDRIAGPVRKRYIATFACVVILMLVSCANAGGLILLRTLTRKRNFSIELVLGASASILRQTVIAEVLIAAIVSISFGSVIAYLGLAFVRERMSLLDPGLSDIGLTPNSILAVGAISMAMIAITILIIIPQLQSMSNAEKFRSPDSYRFAHGVSASRTVLVVIQIAGAVVLVTAMATAFYNLYSTLQVNAGFDKSHLMIVTLSSGDDATVKSGTLTNLQFQAELLARLKAIPIFDSATISTTAPFVRQRGSYMSVEAQNSFIMANTVCFSGDFFKTLRADVQGSWHGEEGEPTAVVSRTLERRVWGGESAVGQFIRVESESIPRRISGVVSDLKLHSLQDEPEPQIYIPIAKTPAPMVSRDSILMIRVSESARAALPTISQIRKSVHEVDPNVYVFDPTTAEAGEILTTAQLRLRLLLLSWLSAFALTVSLVGLFSVLSHSVSGKIHEISIRRAMGATSIQIAWLVVKETFMLCGGGITIGIIVVRVIASIFSATVSEIGDITPMTLLAVSVAVGLCGCLSALPSVIYAVLVDPSTELRHA